MRNIYYIVGDKFSSLADNPSVITVSQFKEIINKHSIDNKKEIHFIVKQGPSQKVIDDLKSCILKHQYFKLTIDPPKKKREKNIFVHKHNDKNVLVSQPEKLDKSLFLSTLMVGNDSALIQDHTTGKHIQGMVLIEAARQMMLSVCERFLLPEDLRFKSYFVLNDVKTKFENFVFPLDVDIFCRVSNASIDKHDQLKCLLCFEFYQMNNRVTKIEMDISTYSKLWIEKREHNLANKVIEHSMINA